MRADHNILTWASNQWPSYRATSNNYEAYHRQVQPAMGSALGKDDALPSVDTLQITPSSTREGTPTDETEDGVAAGKPDLPGLTASCSASADKADIPTSAVSPQASQDPTSTEQKDKILSIASETIATSRADAGKAPLNFTCGPADHLEAYILRPHIDTVDDRIIWSAKVDQLYLDKDALQAHMSKLGPDYSIIDAMSELSPDQIQLIQARTKSRNGFLVAIQYSASKDMVTHMGTFKIQPIMFIVKITVLPKKKELPWPPLGTPQPVAPGAPRIPPVPLPSWALPPPAPVTSFDAADASSDSSDTSSDSTDTPRAQLGKHYFFRVEKNPLYEGGYMTITAQDKYTGHGNERSLEELRLEDYEAGRTNATKASLLGYGSSFGFQSATPVPRRAGGGLFGAGASGGFASPVQQPQQTRDVFGQTSGDGLFSVKPAPGGGLFGGNIGAHQQRQHTGGPFGRAPGSGLFGGAPSGGGLFRGQPTPTGGMFGSTAPTSQQPQQSRGLFGESLSAANPSSGFSPRNNAGGSLFEKLTSPAPGQAMFGQATSIPFTRFPATSGQRAYTKGWVPTGIPPQATLSSFFTSTQTRPERDLGPSPFAALGTKPPTTATAAAQPTPAAPSTSSNPFAAPPAPVAAPNDDSRSINPFPRAPTPHPSCWHCEEKLQNDAPPGAAPTSATAATSSETAVKKDEAEKEKAVTKEGDGKDTEAKKKPRHVRFVVNEQGVVSSPPGIRPALPGYSPPAQTQPLPTPQVNPFRGFGNVVRPGDLRLYRNGGDKGGDAEKEGKGKDGEK
ncbi:Nuclear pore complex protein Nup98-Nup96 [Neocucurbitaria cava]|uniref:Nuclear pore complex protein Nup98-Nup96 n=1 Tax=Neocucurbitaria cava TaxID=798079 RepID=A0A9W8Y7R7_9PLEO|nr:Nuclear pore complex protein Nup98-Nup96 [Neocucurbitaria cava]